MITFNLNAESMFYGEEDIVSLKSVYIVILNILTQKRSKQAM